MQTRQIWKKLLNGGNNHIKQGEYIMTKTEKIIKFIVGLLVPLAFLLSLLFMEYRFIMRNIHPYIGENNTVYIEFCGEIDEYYADDWENYD